MAYLTASVWLPYIVVGWERYVLKTSLSFLTLYYQSPYTGCTCTDSTKDSHQQLPIEHHCASISKPLLSERRYQNIGANGLYMS